MSLSHRTYCRALKGTVFSARFWIKSNLKVCKGTCSLIFEHRPQHLFFIFFFLFPILLYIWDSQSKLLCKPDQFAGQLVSREKRETLSVGARLAICYICDTSQLHVGCRTFQISKCRWKWKKKLSAGSSYAAAHLGFLSSNAVCLMSQYAFLRFNFFFHLLSVAFIAATEKKHTF